MPGFHSHAVFADKMQYEYKNDNKIFLTECDLDTLKTYSLGPDLIEYDFKKYLDAHNKKTKELLLTMIKNVKESKLQDDKYVIALLYGHIMHYYLDINLHPFVYYHELGLTHHGLMDAHTTFEGYLSYYFLQDIKNMHMLCIYPQYYNQGKLDDQSCINILNKTYEEVFNRKNIAPVYKFNLALITAADDIGRLKVVGVPKIKWAFGYTGMCKRHDLKPEDFINETHQEWRNPVNGAVHYESAKELFDHAYQQCLEALEKINGYLYGDKSLNSLEPLFTGLSYDTGLDCSLGHDMPYYKKYPQK